MMRLLQSFSFRMTLTFVALLCLSVLAVMAAFYWASIHIPTTQVRDQVTREANAMTRVHARGGLPALAIELEKRAAATDDRKPFHALIDGNGRVITANLSSWPGRDEQWLRFEADVSIDGTEIDYQPLMTVRPLANGARLLIGRDIEDIDDREEALDWSMRWILGDTVLLGLMGGLLMSWAIHRRLDSINIAARTVMAGDLSGRIALRGTGDDFDRLGEALNMMLARIESLVESVRRVSDTIAHDLRTPLTRLGADLAELELAADDPERQQELTRQAIAEANRLQRLFDALLRIARIESGRHAPEIRPIALAPLVEDVVETYLHAAEACGLILRAEIERTAKVNADPDLVYQALANLIENALKYVPPHGEVVVRLKELGDGVLLSVCDNGPGVSAEDRARLTERFYRAEAVRNLPGEGLGLSLVAAVAAHHDAELRLMDNAPGLCAQILFRGKQF